MPWFDGMDEIRNVSTLSVMSADQAIALWQDAYAEERLALIRTSSPASSTRHALRRFAATQGLAA